MTIKLLKNETAHGFQKLFSYDDEIVFGSLRPNSSTFFIYDANGKLVNKGAAYPRRSPIFDERSSESMNEKDDNNFSDRATTPFEILKRSNANTNRKYLKKMNSKKIEQNFLVISLSIMLLGQSLIVIFM